MTTHDGVKLRLSKDLILALIAAALVPTIMMIYGFGQQNQKLDDVDTKLTLYTIKTDQNTTDIAMIKGQMAESSFSSIKNH